MILDLNNPIVAKAVDILNEICDNLGHVCEDFDLCKHVACADSCGAFLLASNFFLSYPELRRKDGIL